MSSLRRQRNANNRSQQFLQLSHNLLLKNFNQANYQKQKNIQNMKTLPVSQALTNYYNQSLKTIQVCKTDSFSLTEEEEHKKYTMRSFYLQKKTNKKKYHSGHKINPSSLPRSKITYNDTRFTEAIDSSDGRKLKTQTQFYNSKKRQNINQYNLEQQYEIKNNYQEIEKAINKGPLRVQYLERWINNAIVQYCGDEKFDQNIENSALKKYMLDNNSLIAQGLQKEHVIRVYRGLLTFSLGFNTFLSEVTTNSLKKHNKNLRKTLWKIYSILLQYTACGKFQSMVIDIEKDKKIKINAMINELQKKQDIIERNDEINQQKNQAIYKQQKLLKIQNQNLTEQNYVLTQQLKQTEIAFNDEVTLRLKFESKINQMHGAYRELSEKFKQLRMDFNRKIQLIQKMEKNSALVIAEKSALLNENKELNMKINLICQQRDGLILTTNSSNHSKNMFKNELYQLRHKLSILQNDVKSLKLENEQLKSRNKCISQQLESRQKIQNQLRKDVEAFIKQNNYLQKSHLEKDIKIRQMMAQINDFNKKINKIKSENQFYHKKEQQRQDTLKQLKDQLNSKEEEMQKNVIQIKTSKKRIDEYIKALEQNQKAIKEMERINRQFEQKIENNFKYIQELESLYNKVLEQRTQLSQQNIKKQQENSTLKMSISVLSAKISLLEQQSNSQKKFHRLAQTQEKEQKNTAQALLIKLIQENDKLNRQVKQKDQKLEQTSSDLKYFKFQKNGIELRYAQTLKIIESQQYEIKQHMKEKSELNQEARKVKLEHKKASIKIDLQQQQLQKQKQKIMSKYDSIKQQKEKIYNTLSMQLQDLIMRYQIREQQFAINKRKLTEIRQSNNELTHQLKRQKYQKQHILAKNTEEYQQLLKNQQEKWRAQLQYEQLKNQKLKALLKEQQQQNLKANTRNNKQHLLQQKRALQLKFHKQIEEKNKKIEELLQKLAQMHDMNITKVEEINKIKLENQQLNEQIIILNQQIYQKNKFLDDIKNEINNKNITEKIQKFQNKQQIKQQSRPQSRSITEQITLNKKKSIIDIPKEQKEVQQKNEQHASKYKEKSTSKKNHSKTAVQIDFKRKLKNTIRYYQNK